MAQLTVKEYEAREARAEAARQAAAKREEEEARQIEKDIAEAGSLVRSRGKRQSGVELEEEAEDEDEETDELRVKVRAQEILAAVWREYDTRMYTKSTSKNEFFDVNKEKAFALATKEIAEENEKRRLLAIGAVSPSLPLSLSLLSYPRR